MDCAAEERIVRLALQGHAGIRRIDADLQARQVTIVHERDSDEIDRVLERLNLGVRRIDTVQATTADETLEMSAADQRSTLRIVLAINATMFAGEAIGAILADSSALLADSLDMFADATVYAIALFGVQRSRASQLKAARVSGLLQLMLALGALAEVTRRLAFGSDPEAPLMIGVALAALTANVACLWLLARHRTGGAHMRASWIFTTNDVIANLSVIAAAGLVRFFNSNVPDLVVATGIAALVLSGAVRILRLRS